VLDISLDLACKWMGIAMPSSSAAVQGVTIDTRLLKAGQIFFALDGKQCDGHDFLDQARRAGAVAAVVRKDHPALSAGNGADFYLTVEDPLQALGALAKKWLQSFSPIVIGITGSVGKTTAKDYLNHLLGGNAAQVFAAPASYNSETGLPLAILQAPASSQILVLEYGVNEPGEMDQRLRVVHPTHAWLTAISPAHLEGMKTLAVVRTEKEKLLEAATEKCLREEELFSQGLAQWQSKIPGQWSVHLAKVGNLTLPVLAVHEASLATSAAWFAQLLGVKPALIQERMAQLEPAPGRLNLHHWGSWHILDDSYNASPAAMHSAFEVLVNLPGSQRKVGVLGTMHEMGHEKEQYHREVGAEFFEAGGDVLIGIGKGGKWMAEAFSSCGGLVGVFPDWQAAGDWLKQELLPHDAILLKASRKERLERLLPLFRLWAGVEEVEL
jgi:UDP-N-acetylmuramoyl-tripeptide--D-alanyl-D-alanine ligase